MEILIYILIGLVGLCVGSFLNVVIYRVPNKLSIVQPASHCPVCKIPIKWYDNIPIISYIILKGRCRNCKTHISFRYTLIEILNTVFWVVFAILFWKTNVVLAICYMIVSSTLLVISCIDFEHQIIPDRFQILLLALGIIVTIFDTTQMWYSHLIGLGIGAGIMLLFYGLGFLLFKREAMGFGDVKLMGVCGLILGWQNILVAIIVGSIVGAICLLILQKKSQEKNKEYPFAPFLVLGVFFALILGQYIINLYLSIL